MAVLPSAPMLTPGPIATGGTSASAATERLNAVRDRVEQLPGGGAVQALTIGGGAVSPTRGVITVDTEAAASADALDTLNGGLDVMPLGSIVVLHSVDPARVVTVKHRTSGAGHIMLRDSADLVLAHQSMRLELQRVSEDRWIERQRWYGSRKADARDFLGLANSATQPLASKAEAEAGTASTIMTPARVKDALDHKGLMITGRAGAALPLSGMDELLMAQTGVSTLRRLGLWALRQWINTPDDASGLLAITTPTTVATHGLGAEPRLVLAVLACVEDDIGYSASVNGGARKLLATDDTGSSARTVSIGYDNQQAWVILPSTLRLRRRDNGELAEITYSRWRIMFRVWE